MIKGKTIPTLLISLENITLTIAEKSQNLPINLAAITAIFSYVPPSEMAWEHAIYAAEEAISSLKPQLTAYNQLKITGNASQKLQFLPLQYDEKTGRNFINAETLELAFAVLAGYHPLKDLGQDLPYHLLEDREFYAVTLLLGEWVHHLDFKRIYVD